MSGRDMCINVMYEVRERGYSTHEKVRFPFIIDRSDPLLQEQEMVRTGRLFQCGYFCFSKGSVSFFCIAGRAGGDKVLP